MNPLWAAGGRLPRLIGDARADVCVVGLGGAGLVAIERLSAAGRRVIGLDRGGVGAGAAGRNGGFLLAGPAEFHHHLAAWAKSLAAELYGLTVEARDRIMAETPGAEPRGSLRRFASAEEEADGRAQLDALTGDGFSAEWTEGGLLIPGDGTFDPGQRCRWLAQRCAGGAELYGQTEVVEVGPERVVTTAGVVRAEAVLICLDGGFERLVPAERLPSPVRTVRLQMLATAPATDVTVHRAIYHRFGYDYWQQRPDGRIALGGGRDVGGEAEESSEEGVTQVVQTYLEKLLRERVSTRAPITHRWSGLVAYTEDQLPVVGEMGEGIFGAGAYCGHGNVLSALAGHALAEMALGRTAPRIVGLLERLRSAPKS